MTDAGELVARVPVGWSLMTYAGRTWGVTRSVQAGGRAQSVYAEELGGTDVVSTNLYRVGDEVVLRPCEMPAEKVLAFLRDARPAAAGVEDVGEPDPRRDGSRGGSAPA